MVIYYWFSYEILKLFFVKGSKIKISTADLTVLKLTMTSLKFLPRRPSCCFDAIVPPAQSACNFDTSADRNLGKSRLCDRSRSSAIMWKQLASRLSAICDPRSSAIIWFKTNEWSFHITSSLIGWNSTLYQRLRARVDDIKLAFKFSLWNFDKFDPN